MKVSPGIRPGMASTSSPHKESVPTSFHQCRAMRTLILVARLASTAMLSLPASAVEVCDKTCVGPACVKDCVREPSPTVGRPGR
jgi:hypothetical protein